MKLKRKTKVAAGIIAVIMMTAVMTVSAFAAVSLLKNSTDIKDNGGYVTLMVSGTPSLNLRTMSRIYGELQTFGKTDFAGLAIRCQGGVEYHYDEAVYSSIVGSYYVGYDYQPATYTTPKYTFTLPSSVDGPVVVLWADALLYKNTSPSLSSFPASNLVGSVRVSKS